MTRALILIVVASVGVACRGQAPPVREAGLNVLLVTIDTLRADALGSYGNRRAATPVIDRVAAEGVRFTNARAHNVVTLPSHVNILTGLYPYHHGVRENAGFRVPRTVETLAHGEAKTPFLAAGDVVRIEMRDARRHTIFGAIEQRVTQA